jgi:hypothetical protein
MNCEKKDEEAWLGGCEATCCAFVGGGRVVRLDTNMSAKTSDCGEARERTRGSCRCHVWRTSVSLILRQDRVSRDCNWCSADAWLFETMPCKEGQLSSVFGCVNSVR